MSEAKGALEGIRILDFSHVFQGPAGTQLLADCGADVIKIERPGSGDWSRRWGPYIDDVSLPFVSLNRNKRSITLDLKSEAGKEVISELLKTADALVHNFRPGVMERLGLGYEDVKEINPRLVYAKSGGWGDKGPYVERGRGGHDVMARAAAGLFEPCGPDDLPVPVGISADYPAGMLLMLAILMGLVARQRTGRGQLVSTDLLSAAFHTNTWEAAQILNEERITSESGVGSAERTIRTSFETKDGYIELSPVFSDDPLRDISVAMGLGDLSKDPRFADEEERAKHGEEMNAILAEAFQKKTTEEWISLLEPQGVLCAKVNTYKEAAEDPQIEANDMVVEMELPKLGKVRLLGTPVRLYGTPTSLRMPPPELGEHNAQILRELGYSQAEIEALAERGAFG